ncbi:hypothetical protein D8M04_03100 [Oceanobacillus piezotolerans]|uniref:Stage II sporulation protein SA n=1 Tax=Oceanobacillus piezotolerans TaxID=2448030 RepID=A0A498DFG2_9BACI|nr:type II toxin-antitoxin system SpoIISA family toxin [Oceanobacillus piezotolerans]RLL48275.1 hypothetical protein D8M04_03100 [Oceanobacillus piezotolerans]
MENFMLAGVWIVFLLLIIYTTLSWFKKDIVSNVDNIRKVWYLILILGCLIYLTNEPISLFTNWKNYLIVLVVFLIVDSLVFLNLYIVKLGGHELKVREKQVDETQGFLNVTNQKVNNMEKVVNSYEYPKYTRSKEEYVQGLENFFNEYAMLELLNIDILPYRTEKEKEIVLENTPKGKVERVLSINKAYYSSKDNLMLMPLWVMDEDYVAKVSTNSEEVGIYDVDVNIINMLLMVYTLAVDIQIDDKDGE